MMICSKSISCTLVVDNVSITSLRIAVDGSEVRHELCNRLLGSQG